MGLLVLAGVLVVGVVVVRIGRRRPAPAATPTAMSTVVQGARRRKPPRLSAEFQLPPVGGALRQLDQRPPRATTST